MKALRLLFELGLLSGKRPAIGDGKHYTDSAYCTINSAVFRDPLLLSPPCCAETFLGML